MTAPHDAGANATAALTRRLAAGDEEAFREFHEQYFNRLHQFLLVVAYGKEHEAREALQETLVRVARHARVFEDEATFWCWLKTVARNAARDAGRKRTRYSKLLQTFAHFTRPGIPIAPDADDDRLTAVIDECLAELAHDDRALLQDKYLAGATVLELSIREGLTPKAVESRLSRLRRELRERVLTKLRQP
jgi:RNA polymerase sigma-70 factor (ECF subfamily)